MLRRLLKGIVFASIVIFWLAACIIDNVVNQTPAPNPTQAATAVSVQTPVSNPTAVPTPAPTVTPVPPSPTNPPNGGSVSGQVNVQVSSQPAQPAANATVVVIGLPITSGTDHAGKYRLDQVPAGPQFVFAHNQFGDSNPESVIVQNGGSANLNLVMLVAQGGGGSPSIYAGSVILDLPVAGASVWVQGDVSVTKTDRNGRFELVYPARGFVNGFQVVRDRIFVIASDGTRWNGEFRDSDPSKPAPDLELNRTSPPSPPPVAYDLIADASQAQWNGSSGAVKFNGDVQDPRGSARYRTNAVLEDGSSPDRVLEMFARGSGGFIAGVLPKTITIGKNDVLYGSFGLSNQAREADVQFIINFIPTRGSPQELMQIRKHYDGKLQPFAVPLQDYADQSGQFELRVRSNNSAGDANRALWVEAKIGRGQ